MQFKPAVTYTVIMTMFLNLGGPSLLAAYAGASLLFAPSSYAASDTPLLDELKIKYDLDNPNKNHQNDILSPKVQSLIDTPPASKDMQAQINTVYATPVVTKDLQISTKYPNTSSFNDYKDLSVNLSKTHGQPSGSVTGNSLDSLDVTYARSGTRTFVRNPITGALELKVIEGVAKANGVSNTEMFSSELSNSSLAFEANKEGMYEDNTAIYAEGAAINTQFKDPTTGTNSSARGYRAITAGALRANSTTISEDTDWLQASFAELGNSQDPNQWLTACADTTATNTTTYSYGSSTEHRCQDTSQSSFDFCEVERKVKVPVNTKTPGVRSCGEGCYEYLMQVDTWKTSKCRDTYADMEADPASLSMDINFDDGISIKKVTLLGIASDHFRFNLNGQTFWESNGKSQGTTGNIARAGCNISGHEHNINTDVTSTVKTILGAEIGIKSLNFIGDLKWKRGGGMDVMLRIELDGDPDSFSSEFLQFPEGCYDALSEEDKLTRGLDGVYDWSEIGIDGSLPRVYYNCESPPITPTCDVDEILFGNVTQEQCLSTPACNEVTTTLCEAVGFTPGNYIHRPPTCDVGSISDDGERCEYEADLTCPLLGAEQCGTDALGAAILADPNVSTLDGVTVQCTYTSTNCEPTWSTSLDADIACPLGGSADATTCQLPSTKVDNCPAGHSMQSIMVNGVQSNYCSREPVTQTSNTWSCNNAAGFSISSCSVTRESYLDELDILYQTVDVNGFTISPIFDEDFQEVIFKDEARCSYVVGTLPPDEEVPISFCTFDEYSVVLEGNNGFTPEVLAQIPPFFVGDLGERTWRVNLDGYRCDPTNGEFRCYIDADSGEEVCYTWEELRELPDRCEPYKTDSSCIETSRDCTEGWLEEISGRCMAETVMYECTEATNIPYTTTQTTNVCDAMLPCSGGECEIGNQEKNEKFVEAMVAGSVLDNVQGDSTCTDPTDPSTCTIFAGEYEYCSWEVTGLGSDCCEAPSGIDILAYIATANAALEIKQMMAAGRFGEGAQGAYETLSAPITDVTTAVSEWASEGIRSVSESIFGNTESVSNGVSVASEGISAAVAELTQEVYKLVYDLLPDAVNELIFSNAADYGSEVATDLILDEAVTNFFSNVMFVYTVYNLTKLALTLLTACDDNEMDMGVKIAQRQCFSVGDRYCSKDVLGVCYQRRQSYCCYSSILARIVMKEAYVQLGIDPLPYGTRPNMGNGEAAASCRGLTPAELAGVDFSEPSMETALQEWIGLLLDAGEIPSETSEEYLTGGAVVEERTDCPTQQKPVLNCYIDATTLTEICDQARDANGILMYEDIPTDCGGKLTGGNSIWNANDRVIASERIAGPDGYIGTAADRVQETKDQMRTLPTDIDCSAVPKMPVCFFGFDPVESGP
jgi:hypothetical protein